jgi:hypothetical protein
MSTRHSARPAPPWVGDASVVMIAFGVWVRRASAPRMTVMPWTPIIDNVIVYIVNLVVVHVN